MVIGSHIPASVQVALLHSHRYNAKLRVNNLRLEVEQVDILEVIFSQRLRQLIIIIRIFNTAMFTFYYFFFHFFRWNP